MKAVLNFGSLARWMLRWLLDPFLRVVVAVESALVDARFVRRQQLPTTLSSRILYYPSTATERLRRGISNERQNLLFERYSRLHRIHYGPNGRGYQSIAEYSPDERARRYREQSSRLEFFIDNYRDLLQFNNGDSFLEFGCGTGQNIRMLAERFPASEIVGYDLNHDAVNFVRECERHSKLHLGTGDLTNDEFRVQALADGFDHIILSHVFSLLFERSRLATEVMRRKILGELVAACRVSVVLVDAFGTEERPTIRIEQRQRAIVGDDLLGYFIELQRGNAYMVQSDQSRAIVFRKCRPGWDGTVMPELKKSGSQD